MLGDETEFSPHCTREILSECALGQNLTWWSLFKFLCEKFCSTSVSEALPTLQPTVCKRDLMIPFFPELTSLIFHFFSKTTGEQLLVVHLLHLCELIPSSVPVSS